MIIKKIIKKILSYFNIYIFNSSSSKNRKDITNFFNKLKIYDCGYKLIRIGGPEDGGYLVPDIFKNTKVKYCFSPGVGAQTSFEDNLLNYNIKSFLADHTIEYKGKHDFTKKKLGSFDDKKVICLENWIQNKKATSNNNLMLQMDIEGSEIDVILSTKLSTFKRFKIILIEFHHFHSIVSRLGLNIYNTIFDKLQLTHSIVHIHPNNMSNTKIINGINIPDVMEITFINNDLIKYKKKIRYALPHKYDKKNLESLKDIKCPEIFYKHYQRKKI